MSNPKVTNVLLVGISDYEPRDEDGLEIDLNGCVFDAKAMLKGVVHNAIQYAKANPNRRKRRKALRKIRKGKIDNLNVVSLHDKEATADNVRAKLAELCLSIEPGEAGIFYRSGHGTVISKAYESDGTDEAFCAYDALNGGYVIDDEIGGIIAANLHKDALLYIIADTCHAGDSHRSANLLQTRGMLAPASSVKDYHKNKTFVYSDVNPKNVIALYASASDQYSYEQIDEDSGHVRGVYTLQLERFIPSIMDGSIDLDAMHIEVSRAVAAFNTETRIQTPQLERYA